MFQRGDTEETGFTGDCDDSFGHWYVLCYIEVSSFPFSRITLCANIQSLGSDAPNGWKTPYVLVFLILGVVLIAAFIVWEVKYPYAMIDMNIWKDRDFSLVSSPVHLQAFRWLTGAQLLIMLSCGFLGFPVLTFFLSLYFQTELGYSALMTGVHMLPMVVVGLLANLVAALILHRVSNKLMMGIGAIAYVVSFVLVAVQRYGDSYWAFSFPALCLCVIGADFQFNVANVSTSSPHTFTTPINCYRCMFSLACLQIGNQSPDRCSRPSHVSVLLLDTVLRPRSSTP
jgi:hypothetical protein